MQVNLINENVKSKYKQLLKIKKLIIDTKITEKENMDLIKQELKIKELEQQKAELIEFVKDIVDYEAERVLREREILLNKYK